jgi:hypothetical protein
MRIFLKKMMIKYHPVEVEITKQYIYIDYINYTDLLNMTHRIFNSMEPISFISPTEKGIKFHPFFLECLLELIRRMLGLDMSKQHDKLIKLYEKLKGEN